MGNMTALFGSVPMIYCSIINNLKIGGFKKIIWGLFIPQFSKWSAPGVSAVLIDVFGFTWQASSGPPSPEWSHLLVVGWDSWPECLRPPPGSACQSQCRLIPSATAFQKSKSGRCKAWRPRLEMCIISVLHILLVNTSPKAGPGSRDRKIHSYHLRRSVKN